MFKKIFHNRLFRRIHDSKIVRAVSGFPPAQMLWRNKKPILITTVLLTALCVGYNFLGNYYKSAMKLTISYPGTEKSENPDGTRFNMFEIKSDAVLDRALSYGTLPGMTVDDLRDRIDVFALAPASAASKVITATTAGKDYYYIPNEFSISYSQTDKFTVNKSIDVLEAVARAYTEIFKEKYAEKNNVLTDPIVDTGKYEYVEIADLYTNKLNEMEGYISSHAMENGTFKASSTGQTFNDILTVIQNLRSIEVAKFKGYVVTSGLAKDNSVYLKKLSYSNKMLHYDFKKANEARNFTVQAIAQYDANITGVAFIPTLDKNSEFYMNRTKIGIDYLTESAYKNGMTADNINSDMESNNSLINTFSTVKLTDDQKTSLTETANAMLRELDERIAEISKVAVETDNEYLNYKTRNYLKFNIPEKTLLSAVNVKLGVMAAAFFLVVSCVYFIGKERLLGEEETDENHDI